MGEEHIEERFDSELNASAGSEGMFTPTATEEIFSYDGDKLVQYGFANYVNYDKLGCPSSYNGNECEWEYGKLKRFGGTNFTYDGYGRRIGKDGTTFTYDTEGKLKSQNGGNGNINFIYDGNEIIGIDYNSDIYYFRKDMQGNVIEIAGSMGSARYIYDAWGNCKIIDAVGNDITQDMTNIGYINPIRYRSYYYDTETNLYYLNTRYYDPATGRFISPDSLEYIDPETINGLNLYAYCGNNPVMNVDPDGTAFWDFIANFFIKVGSAVVNFAVNNIYNGIVKPAHNWVSNVGYPVANYLLTKTLPDFLINTVWNDWIVGTVWNKGLVPAWEKVSYYFTNTVPDFVVNTLWKDWIIDKALLNGIIPAVSWVLDNRETILDWVFAILGGAATIVGIVGLGVSLPLWLGIGCSVAGLASFVWTIGRLSGGW